MHSFQERKKQDMDLSSIDDLEFFEQISRSQSLTEAARNWGRSVSAVSKRLAALESRLGVPLVRRSTRRLTLTEEGQRYASGALAILQQKTDLKSPCPCSMVSSRDALVCIRPRGSAVSTLRRCWGSSSGSTR
jgi:DNA-binding transcriptional LysR family regulator